MMKKQSTEKRTSQGLDENLHAGTTTQTQHQVKRGLLLDVVVRERAVVLELLAGKDEALLVWRNAFLVLDLGFHVCNGIGRLHIERDGFARKGLDENLHTGHGLHKIQRNHSGTHDITKPKERDTQNQGKTKNNNKRRGEEKYGLNLAKRNTWHNTRQQEPPEARHTAECFVQRQLCLAVGWWHPPKRAWNIVICLHFSHHFTCFFTHNCISFCQVQLNLFILDFAFADERILCVCPMNPAASVLLVTYNQALNC